jgi:hypothetical protein
MIRFSFFAASVWLAMACSAAPSQTVRQITPTAPQAPKQVVPREAATPFPPDAWTPISSATVQMRPVEQMTAQDRALVAGADATIAGQAGMSGMEFTSGRWSYRQIVCPAFPNHLFLRFTRNQDAGDVSVFSASIPRDGKGRVRIIPIQRRSYSLFSPAPENAMTVAAFNHIRAEEQSMMAGGWADVGLCYAALAGANPQLARPDELERPDEWSGEPHSYPASSAELSYPSAGGAILQFTDVSARPRPVEWSLVFDAKGKLLKAALRHSPMIVAKETHPRLAPEPTGGQAQLEAQPTQ